MDKGYALDLYVRISLIKYWLIMANSLNNRADYVDQSDNEGEISSIINYYHSL